MEELACFAIVLALCGPVAVIFLLVLYSKLEGIKSRLERLETRVNQHFAQQPVSVQKSITPAEADSSLKPQAPPPMSAPVSKPAESVDVPVSAAAAPKPVKVVPDLPPMSPVAPIPSVTSPPKKPVMPPSVQKAQTAVKSGLEQKIGITVALIAGVITVIVGVGFFLKYVYENKLFSDTARVCMVAVGGLISLTIGEIIRRRDYGIVAKGLAALGFALLYASVFSASQVYHLIEPSTALVLALCISGAAMAYAVTLNERFIAFLSLLGGYLSPLVIMYHQDMPMPIFTYVLALSVGAMGAAMFRRWRAVNWIAMVGAYLLYSVWYEQFYSPALIATPLTWLFIFAAVYLIQPVIYGLVRKVAARSEDVTLVVINSVAVFYYLCRILYADYQEPLALAITGFGITHLLLMGVVMVRCRNDKNLPAVLNVLGISMITTAIGLYFAEMSPKILAWAMEAVVLTFVGIRYRSLLTRAMSFLVAAVSVLGLLYLLPLHDAGQFKLIFNGSFGTWFFVAAAFVICHGMWRWMPEVEKQERPFGAQGYYIAGALLLAGACGMEWYAYCSNTIELSARAQSFTVMGLVLISAVLLAALASRPVCPKGRFLQVAAIVVAICGAIFTGISVMGVYYTSFTLFWNVPFLISCIFAACLFWIAYQFYRWHDKSDLQKQFADGMLMTGLMLVGVLISEQIYMFWYCRNQYAQPIADWKPTAWKYLAITWTLYGLATLYAGIHFRKNYIKGISFVTTVLSAVALCYWLPTHQQGDFRFVFNLTFISWICVAVGFIIGHGLWRFLPKVEKKERFILPQLYYIAGLLLMGVGAGLEWYAHCRWQITPTVLGDSNFMQGCIVLTGLVFLGFFVRALSPQGPYVHAAGLAVGLAGAVYSAVAMNEVYFKSFTVLANVPFIIAMFYVAVMLVAAFFVKDQTAGKYKIAPWVVFAAMVLMWILLSEQIYQYFYCRNQYSEPIENWQFSAQMVMSLSWAIYAAVLLLIGFFYRAAGVRYLSLGIFTILLGKINWDIQELPTEYRIATFVTTGLILVGVSFLYQFLKNKGFFDVIQDKKTEQLQENPVNPVNPA